MKLLCLTHKERKELEYALDVMYHNRNTEGDPERDKLSVRAYHRLKELFLTLGIEV